MAYQQSEKGKVRHRRRQNRYRKRLKRTEKLKSKTNVTYQTCPSKNETAIPALSQVKETTCSLCGRIIMYDMQESSHPATKFRQLRRHKKRRGLNGN